VIGEKPSQASVPVEYASVNQISGPLVFVSGVTGAGYDELVTVASPEGESLGRVLEVSKDVAVVEVFKGTSGLSIGRTKVKFLGRGLEVGLSQEVLGRIFDG